MENKLTNRWKLRDLILMGILGVLFAAIYLAIFDAGLIFQAALTPFGLGTFAFEIIYGIWFMGATLAMYLIRKPGVALVTEVLAAFIEMLMGNSGGALAVITGLIQGAGSELGFTVFGYRRFGWPQLIIGSILPAIFTFFEEWYLYGLGGLSAGILIAKIVIRMISGIVFASVIVKLAGDGLAKTGVMKNYAIGQDQKEAEILED